MYRLNDAHNSTRALSILFFLLPHSGQQNKKKKKKKKILRATLR